MSVISDFFEKITGLDLDGSSQTASEHPCSNCPSDCAIAGEACTLCEPYKKKLIDAVYHVDHIDEFRAQYEVVGPTKIAENSGTITCPRCGGPSSNHYICDFCGAKLAEAPVSSGKIQVAVASDIPNPIMDAQDIIYERYDAIVKKYTEQKASSGGFLSNLFAELVGSESNDDNDSALGAKMSEAEIEEAAGLYNVTVGDYLTGLDNGKYLNLTAKKQADAAGHANWSPSSAGMAGMAGIGMIAAGLMNSDSKRRPQDIPQRIPQQHDRPRPSYSEDRPSQRRPRTPQYDQRPSLPDDRRSPEPERQRPSSQNSSRTPQRSQPASSEHWKERDPSRRRRG
ncbi:MAG: hypothetical protein IJI45_13430 [Anaerolineaceae bacterium]|nr:hypothetical protein [Anaerolineaceae bacterium]